jgi:hypothetical protein
LVPAVVEDLAETGGARAAIAAERIEAAADRHRGGESAMDGVLDDRGEVLVVEHAGEIDECARRAGHRERPDHPTVVRRDDPAVHDDELRAGVRRLRYPELGLRCRKPVELPQSTCRAEADHRVGVRPQQGGEAELRQRRIGQRVGVDARENSLPHAVLNSAFEHPSGCACIDDLIPCDQTELLRLDRPNAGFVVHLCHLQMTGMHNKPPGCDGYGMTSIPRSASSC